jgi:hypothetical protein
MTDSSEAADETDPVTIDVETGESENDEPVAEEPASEEGPRAIAFEKAVEKLAPDFEIDGRKGETITDLETTETEDGRQVVATVETSRSTMLSHRVASAKRTGRRAGIRAALLGALAAVVYAVFAGRRRVSESDADESPFDEPTDDDVSIE